MRKISQDEFMMIANEMISGGIYHDRFQLAKAMITGLTTLGIEIEKNDQEKEISKEDIRL